MVWKLVVLSSGFRLMTSLVEGKLSHFHFYSGDTRCLVLCSLHEDIVLPILRSPMSCSLLVAKEERKSLMSRIFGAHFAVQTGLDKEQSKTDENEDGEGDEENGQDGDDAEDAE